MKKIRIKTGKKVRVCYVPNSYERSRLSEIKKKLEYIYFSLGIPESVHGFTYGRNCITNAKEHTGKQFTISVDLENFFDSINKSHLKDIPEQYYPFILVRGAPRQGLLTSPIVSNIAMREFDIEMQEHARYFDIVYTRYADDITISGSNLGILKEIITYVRKLLSRMHLTINESKTKVQSSKGGRRIITGISVGDDIRASRKSRRKLRAALHQRNTAQAAGLEEWCKCPIPWFCDWVIEGDLENPIVSSVYNNFKSGRRRPTRTFRGSRAVFKRFIMRKFENGN